MKTIRLSISAAAIAAGLTQSAAAEDERTRTVTLPAVTVAQPDTNASQPDVNSIGVTGASTTVITAREIERAPQESLVDIISREAGVQSTNLQGGVNNAGNTGTVDLRGFGVAAPSNTLVLVDGRRFNDSDLTGFDFSLIPRNAIERIEIVRGNSGAVLYGDGAVGGVINIVTKNGIGRKPGGAVEVGAGSLGTREAKVSVAGSKGSFSSAVFGNFFKSDGYRINSKTEQQQGIGDFRYTSELGSAFFNIGASHVDQRLPGPRNIANGGFVGFFNEYAADRRGTNTPFDNAQFDNLLMRGGFSRTLSPGLEAIVDGSFRQKDTTFQQFNARNGFLPADAPSSYNSTTLNTYSVTPRVNYDRMWGDVRARMIAGVDVYKTDYDSTRRLFAGAAPQHLYNINQTTSGYYAQPTFTLWNTTDIAFGGRIQRNELSARDTFDPNAPVGLLGTNGQGAPLDTNETRHAWHVGIEHRFTSTFAVFARAAQSFRVPNVDERVGQAPAGGNTNFNLRTQRSHDIEGGVRFNLGAVIFTSSIYEMNLVDELRFNPITGVNTNFDPTRRTGWDSTLSWRVSEAVRIKSTLTHIDAEFRRGPFAGNTVPEVADWSGSSTLSWDIYGPYLTTDITARYFSSRFVDGDEANVGRVKVPAYGLVDLRLGGAYEQMFWSVSVQNLLDKKYFDYGLDTSFPANTFVSVYPLPGRTFMARAGVTF